MREFLASLFLSWVVFDIAMLISPLPPRAPLPRVTMAAIPPPPIACDIPKDQSRVASLRPDELLPSRKVATESYKAPLQPAAATPRRKRAK